MQRMIAWMRNEQNFSNTRTDACSSLCLLLCLFVCEYNSTTAMNENTVSPLIHLTNARVEHLLACNDNVELLFIPNERTAIKYTLWEATNREREKRREMTRELSRVNQMFRVNATIHRHTNSQWINMTRNATVSFDRRCRLLWQIWIQRTEARQPAKRIFDFSICFAILRCAHHISVYGTCATFMSFFSANVITPHAVVVCSCAIFRIWFEMENENTRVHQTRERKRQTHAERRRARKRVLFGMM